MTADGNTRITLEQFMKKFEAQRAAENATSSYPSPPEEYYNQYGPDDPPHPLFNTPRAVIRPVIRAQREKATGQFHAFTPEDKTAYDIHCAGMVGDFQPKTYREKTLAIAIAENTWRLSRARALENNIFAMAMSEPMGDIGSDDPETTAAICQAKVWLKDAAKLQLLTLYESRIRRNIEKDQKELTQLQTIRLDIYNKALAEAVMLAHFSIYEGKIYDPFEDFPSENGFEFSSEQITLLAHREIRVRKAQEHQKQTTKITPFPQTTTKGAPTTPKKAA